MKLKSTYLLLTVLAFIFTSCGTLRIKAPVPYGGQADINKVAIIAAYITPPVQPEMPLADASAFNRKTNGMVEEISKMLQKKANQYYGTLANGLGIQLGVQTPHGEQLKESERYERLAKKEESEALMIKGSKSSFKQIFINNSTFNPFPFDKGEVNDFLKKSPRLKSMAKSIARDLGVDGTACSVTTLEIDGVASLGKSAKAKLVSNIYIYNDDGDLVGHGYGETEEIQISGDIFEEYEAVMDQYPELQNLILTEMLSSYKSKEAK